MPTDLKLWGRKLEVGDVDDAELELAARLRGRRTDPPAIDDAFNRQLRARLTSRTTPRRNRTFALIGGGLALATLALMWLILSRPRDVAQPASATPEATWNATDVARCAQTFGPMPQTPIPVSVIATQEAAALPGGYPGMQEGGAAYQFFETQVADATRSLPARQAQYMADCLHPSTPQPTPTLALTPGADLPPGLVFRSVDTIFQVDQSGQAHTYGPVAQPESVLSPDGEREFVLRYDVMPRILLEVDRRTGQQRELGVLPAELTTERGVWPGHDDRLLVSGELSTGGLPRAIGFVDLTTGKSTVLSDQVPPDASVSFSSDGKTLAYSLTDSVVILDIDSGQMTTLTLAELDTQAEWVGHLGWSRDGVELAIETGIRGNPGEGWRTIVAYSLQARSVRQIVRDANPVQRTSAEITWSPDGEWLAVPTFQGVDMALSSIFGVCFISRHGSESPWCADHLTAWSPDGTRAIVQPWWGGESSIVDLATRQTRPLNGLPDGAYILGWRSTDATLALAPTWTPTPTPTPIPPLVYLWPRRLPQGYQILGVFDVEDRGYTIELRPPQSGREGGFILTATLSAGSHAEMDIAHGNPAEATPITVRNQPGSTWGSGVCWIELANAFCLSIMDGSLDEVLQLADGLDVVSPDEWQILRQSLNTPTPLPAPTATAAAMLPAAPAGIAYASNQQLWIVDAAGTPQADEAFPPGGILEPNGQRALFERDGDLWITDLTTGDTWNVTNSVDRRESSARWWPERPETIAYLYTTVDLPEGSDYPPTYVGLIQADGSQQQTLSTPWHWLTSFDLGRDGKSVVYMNDRILLRRLSEAEPRQIDLSDAVDADAYVLNPLLSPDGRWIAARVLSRWSPDNLNQAVALYETATGATHIIGRDTLISEGREIGPHPGVWTPDGAWVLLFNESDYHNGLRPVRIADGFLAETIPGEVVAFSPNGRQAIVHEVYRPEGGYVLYETETWRSLGRLPLPDDALVVNWR